jgi:hypothetical protein
VPAGARRVGSGGRRSVSRSTRARSDRPAEPTHFGPPACTSAAALIGASVQVTSEPGRGTRVRVSWRDDAGGR